MKNNTLRDKLEGCEFFTQTVKVIGEERALEELSLVVNVGCMLDAIWVEAPEDVSLSWAFIWVATPQGHKFWYNVDRGVNPYEK